MPYITDEEQKKFIELLENEKKEKIREKIDRKVYIEDLASRVKGLLDLNKSYGPMEAYARTFAKFVKNDFEAHETDVLFFKWSEIQRYLTDVNLEVNEQGNLTIKMNLRKRLRELGICCRINRKYDTFTVKKCEPSKKVK